MRNLGLILAVVLVIACPLSASADLILNSYDLIVTNNLSTTSEVEGRTIVGGTLSGQSTQFGFKLAANTNTSLLVNNITDTGTVTASTGNLVYATKSGTGTLIAPNGSVIQSASAVANTLLGLSTYLTNVSADYSSLTTNSNYTLSGNSLSFTVNNAALPTTGATAGVAVFSIAASVLNSGTNLSIDLSKGNATSVIINVTGSGGVSLANSDNFQGGFQNNAASILFNFQNETSVALTNSFYGAILAPNATLTDTAGAINGSVYVQNFNQTNEVHLPVYSGFVPAVTSVPEPASVLSTLAGLAMVGSVAWQRRRSSCRA